MLQPDPKTWYYMVDQKTKMHVNVNVNHNNVSLSPNYCNSDYQSEQCLDCDQCTYNQSIQQCNCKYCTNNNHSQKYYTHGALESLRILHGVFEGNGFNNNPFLSTQSYSHNLSDKNITKKINEATQNNSKPSEVKNKKYISNNTNYLKENIPNNVINRGVPQTTGKKILSGGHKCKKCNKVYKHLCNLRSHYNVHTDRAYICEWCGKKFGRKANYTQHRRVHTGERPFKCTYCTKTFKQQHAWKRHIASHEIKMSNNVNEL
eukprot:269131_1